MEDEDNNNVFTITIGPSDGLIDLNSTMLSTSYINTIDTSTFDSITGLDISNIRLDDTITSISWPTPVEWTDCFPDFNTVEQMCKEYPGLEKAFENFKTVYKLVEQDYKSKSEDDQDNLF